MPGSVIISALTGAALGSIFPGAVGIVGGAKFLGLTGAAAGALKGAVIYGGLTGAQFALNKLFGPDQKPLAAGTGRQQLRAEAIPARWVIGRARLGGWVCWMKEGVGPSDGENAGYRHLLYVAALSEGSCEDIEAVFINGKREPFVWANPATREYLYTGDAKSAGTRATVYADQAAVTDAQKRAGILVPRRKAYTVARHSTSYPDDPESFDPNVQGQYSRYIPGAPGDEGDRDDHHVDRITIWPFLNADGDHSHLYLGGPRSSPEASLWTSRHRMHGISYMLVDLFQPGRDDDADNPGEHNLFNAIPPIEVLVKGIRINTVLRTAEGTNPAWTEAASDCVQWVLRKRAGISGTVLRSASFRNARAVCNTVVTPKGMPADYPPSFKRYTANMIVQSTDDNGQLLRELLFACAGQIYEAGGRIGIRVGVDDPATRSLTDDMIIETLSVRPAPAYQDRLNAIRLGLSQSVTHDYGPVDLPAYVDCDALARDGDILLEADLGRRACIDNITRAFILQAIELRRARGVAIHKYRLDPGEDLATGPLVWIPGNIVSVTNSVLGLDAHRMVLVEKVIRSDMTVEVTLKDSPAGTYAMNPTLPPLLSDVDGPPTGPPIEPPAPDPAATRGFQWRGEWAVGTAYAAQDIVRLGRSTFSCRKAHTSTDLNKPSIIDGIPIDNEWWGGFALGGLPGADGEDGNGREDIYARTPYGTTFIRSSRLPSNSWGFDTPGTRGGLTWSDDVPRKGTIIRQDKVWHAFRAVPGTPAKGTLPPNDLPSFTAANNRKDGWSRWSPARVAFEDGFEGEPGTPGEDGNGYEWIYARVSSTYLGSSTTIPSSGRPLNSWRFDRPGTRGGVTWRDDPPSAANGFVVFESWRRVKGTPGKNEVRRSGDDDYVLSNWSIPTIFLPDPGKVIPRDYDSTCWLLDRVLVCWGINRGSHTTPAPYEYTTTLPIPAGKSYARNPVILLMPWGSSGGNTLDATPILWRVTKTSFTVRNMQRAYQWIAIGYIT